MLGWLNPVTLFREQVEIAKKLCKGAEVLAGIREEELTADTAPKEEVHRDGKMRLFHYLPAVAEPLTTPVVIVYALFNRYYMIDLQPDRSLVRNLLARGLDLYVIDWGYPDGTDRWLTLDDYVNAYIDDCVELLRQRHGVERVNVVGICQGGVSSLCYTALHPEKVKNLVTMVTPVDFHAGRSLVPDWIQAVDVDVAVDALGSIPGEMISLGFLLRSPFERNLRKYMDLIDIADDRDKLLGFLRMEKWIFDSPDCPGEAYRQWIKDFYQENKLIKGEIDLGGRVVDLGGIKTPVLNVYAEHDDLIPKESAAALERYVGTDDYRVCSFPVGHIGMYVSGRVQRDLPRVLSDWLHEHD